MYVKGENRQTVSFRLSRAQLELLDKYTLHFEQGRGELLREAVQMWLSRQSDTNPLPQVIEVALNEVS